MASSEHMWLFCFSAKRQLLNAAKKKPGALHPIEVLHLILLELPLKFIFKAIYVHLNNLPKEGS